jgi:hypothetical protein
MTFLVDVLTSVVKAQWPDTAGYIQDRERFLKYMFSRID